MMKQRYSKSAGCKTHSTPHFPRPMVVVPLTPGYRYRLSQVLGTTYRVASQAPGMGSATGARGHDGRDGRSRARRALEGATSARGSPGAPSAAGGGRMGSIQRLREKRQC